jgi:hypothetical protein
MTVHVRSVEALRYIERQAGTVGGHAEFLIVESNGSLDLLVHSCVNGGV